jgi:hypothetical protein
MSLPSLRADCARCDALCCVALAFDRSPQFAIAKAAGEPCRHLDGAGRCRIHADLAGRGFSGCAAYDCFGAGQAASRLFRGRSWRGSPARLAAMMAAFADLRALHETLVLLKAARALPLTPEVRAELEAVMASLAPRGGWSRRALAEGQGAAATARARAFLPGLKGFAAGRTDVG